MNSLSKLSFLVMALALGACNEKVSPELQGAASSSTTGGSSGGSSVINPDLFYFRVVNTADTLLNFKLHKSGAGNANTNCEVGGTTPLSSNAYRSDPSTYDISCFYEAEELSLHANGFSFALEASPNTCQYVGYAPFSYYNKLPGDSTGAYTETICGDNTDTAFLQLSFPNLVCDTHVATPGVTTAFNIPDGEEAEVLCRFNDVENEKLCDIGKITVTSRSFTRDAGVDGIMNTGDDVLSTSAATTRKITCGGKVVNCIDGPIKSEPILAKSTGGMVVTNTTLNKAFSAEKVLPKLIGVYGSNRQYVNYRRDLASFEIEYGNSDKPLTSSYLSSFGDPLYGRDFNPELMMNYSRNMRMNGSALIPVLPTIESNRYWAKPLAGEPFLGLGGNVTNAFYYAYCFDGAFDIKARIKMTVRDWDRVLSSSASDTSFERISDVDLLPPFARQDVPYTDEISGDPDSWNAFNDISDWDDIISMERDDSGVGYNPATTIWRPLPDPSYPTGFFNPGQFSSDKIED